MTITNDLTIKHLLTEKIKHSLLRNERMSQLEKKRHGLNAREYTSIQEKVWTKEGLHELIPLWEESLDNLDISITHVISTEPKVITLFDLAATIEGSKNSHLIEHFIKKVEEKRSSFAECTRRLHLLQYHPPGSMQRAFALFSQSELLTKDIASVLYSLGSELPSNLKELKLGNLTVIEHVTALKERPEMLHHKVLTALSVRPDGHKVNYDNHCHDHHEHYHH